ncbi:MAG: hypothetical protein AAF694_28820 [Bacteroidota bacterium]
MLSPQKKNFWILLTFLAIAFTAFRLLNANTRNCRAYSYEMKYYDFEKPHCKQKKHKKHHSTHYNYNKKDRKKKRCGSSSQIYWVE